MCLQVRKALGVEERPPWKMCNFDIYDNFAADYMLNVRSAPSPGPDPRQPRLLATVPWRDAFRHNFTALQRTASVSARIHEFWCPGSRFSYCAMNHSVLLLSK